MWQKAAWPACLAGRKGKIVPKMLFSDGLCFVPCLNPSCGILIGFTEVVDMVDM